MAKSTQETTVQIGRKSRYQQSHSFIVSKDFGYNEEDFKDNVEIIDAKGNITTEKRDFSQVEDYKDYSIPVLLETNPQMLTGNPLTMSAGTPISKADKIGEFMDSTSAQYDKKVNEALMNQAINSIEDNKEVKVEE